MGLEVFEQFGGGDEPPTRREEAEHFFEGSLRILRLIESPKELTEEESDCFETHLKRWFRDFARRPGNVEMPVEALRGPLLVMACRYVADYKRPAPAVTSGDAGKEKTEGKPGEGKPEEGKPDEGKPPDPEKEKEKS